MEQLQNKTLVFFNQTDLKDLYFTMSLLSWVILLIALPLIMIAIHELIFLIKTDNVTPVYVINLLVSDVIQICTKPVLFSISPGGIAYEVLFFVYSVGIVVSTFFMVCIVGERYVMIAHPLWYRCHKTVTKSFICSFIVWIMAIAAMSGILLACIKLVFEAERMLIFIVIICLLPYPFVIFFFLETWRALSKSISLSPQEQRRIMGTIAIVMLIYTVLFMPYIAMVITFATCPEVYTATGFYFVFVASSTLLSLNPLADPILYVFIRNKGLLCLPLHQCCKPNSQDHPESVNDVPMLNSMVSDTGDLHV